MNDHAMGCRCRRTRCVEANRGGTGSGMADCDRAGGGGADCGGVGSSKADCPLTQWLGLVYSVEHVAWLNRQHMLPKNFGAHV